MIQKQLHRCTYIIQSVFRWNKELQNRKKKMTNANNPTAHCPDHADSFYFSFVCLLVCLFAGLLIKTIFIYYCLWSIGNFIVFLVDPFDSKTCFSFQTSLNFLDHIFSFHDTRTTTKTKTANQCCRYDSRYIIIHSSY